MEKIKMLREGEKAITLIALIITIIVLLILAGISIATLTGENGILTQAGKSKTETTIGEEKEQVKMSYLSVMMGKVGEENKIVSAEELQEELVKIVGENQTKCTNNDDMIKVLFIETANQYIVTKDGEVIYKQPLDYPTFATQTTAGDYGKYVNYNIDYDKDGDTSDDWRVFYNDGESIYLISSDYVYLPEYDTGYSSYCSLDLDSLGYPTVDLAIDFLLDKEKWVSLKDSAVAQYAVGATTIEMFANSWNENHEDNVIYLNETENGFSIGNTENPTDIIFSFESDRLRDLYYVASGEYPYGSTDNMWIASKMNNGNIIRAGYNINSYEGNVMGTVKRRFSTRKGCWYKANYLFKRRSKITIR